MKHLLLILLLSCCGVRADDISLAWDASSSPEVAGYKIHIGISPGNYALSVDVGNQLTYTASGLTGPAVYYFAATAYDATGNESTFSNEVSQTVQSLDFLVRSQACAADWYGAVCMVSTTLEAQAIFRYRKLGSADSWLTIVATPTAWKTEHRALIQGQPGGTYFEYQWTVTDSNGVERLASGTFRTQ